MVMSDGTGQKGQMERQLRKLASIRRYIEEQQRLGRLTPGEAEAMLAPVILAQRQVSRYVCQTKEPRKS